MAEDPKPPDTPSPPEAAADKPASAAPGEPLTGEVSRTDSPGAGASAAPVGPPRQEPPAPKPANPAAAQTATTSETSSATGQPTAPAAAAAGAKPPAPAGAKPAAASAAGAASVPKAPHAPPAAAAPTGPPDPPPPAGTAIPAFITTLQNAVPGSVEQISFFVGDWTIIVPVAQLIATAHHLRTAADALFDSCSDVTATDWPPRKAARFDVVYTLYSTRLRQRVRLKTKVGELQPVPSVSGEWPGANWLEREVYDMFGVNFTGHPDRRRILMPDDWQGFPQRKDYPLGGIAVEYKGAQIPAPDQRRSYS